MNTLSKSSICATVILVAFLLAPWPLYLTGCSTDAGKTLASIQNNPGVQAAETAAIDIGLTLATKSPAFSYVAPIAVSGLTALADGSNPTAVTGTNIAADAQLITQTVAAAVPNGAGKTIATQIAGAYASAMKAPGVPQTPTGANAVIGAIASGLTTAAASAPQATAPVSSAGVECKVISEKCRFDKPFGWLRALSLSKRLKAPSAPRGKVQNVRSIACRGSQEIRPSCFESRFPEPSLAPRPAQSVLFRNRLPAHREEDKARPPMFASDQSAEAGAHGTSSGRKTGEPIRNPQSAIE